MDQNTCKGFYICIRTDAFSVMSFTKTYDNFFPSMCLFHTRFRFKLYLFSESANQTFGTINYYLYIDIILNPQNPCFAPHDCGDGCTRTSRVHPALGRDCCAYIPRQGWK